MRGGDMDKITRRGFIKRTVAAGVGIAAFPMIFIPKVRAHWAPKTIVHPNVDNLRVVGITDAKMIKPGASFYGLNKFIVQKTIWENIDKLACSLAQTSDPQEAWRTIFIKPPGKSWSDTVVALKFSSVPVRGYQTPSAIVAKVCNSLIRFLAVKPFNIHIYDAVHGAYMKKFEGLPEGCRIEERWGGLAVEAQIPKPWPDTVNKGKAVCLKQLVDGSIDILINIAKCRGHVFSHLGSFTLAMKNHFGSFYPHWGHPPDNGLDYLIAINQTSEILGSMDKRTGRVLYPRQQLCLIDGLYVVDNISIHQTNFLAMGVLAPIVDYQVGTKFLKEKMEWNIPAPVTHRMLSDFGYSESDLPAGGKIIEV
jgi:hypothetical protein